MDQLRQDLRYALRTLVARPGFSAVVIVTLGLGIGINSAIFTLVNAVMLKPLPVHAPEEIVNIYTTDEDGSGFNAFSYPGYLDLVERTDLFTDVVGYGGLMANLTGRGEGEVVFGEFVTANYFGGLGVSPQLGRAFSVEETTNPGTPPVAIISARLWRRAYGAAPDVIGKDLSLNGVKLTIVGVAPDDFHGVLLRGFSLEVWAPIALRPVLMPSAFAMDRRDNGWVTTKARLKPGVTIEQVRAGLTVLSRTLEQAHPATQQGRQFRVVAMTDVYIHPNGDRGVATIAVFMMGAVGLVLLIACTNVANLSLARALGRRREIALRLALGAGRRRLMQQLMVESLVLAGAGGVVGLTLAYWLAALMLAFNPPFPVAINLDFGVDWRVVAFAGGISVLTGLVFGLIPALQATNPALVPALKGQSAAGRPGGSRFRNALLLPQVALSLLLLIVAGLFARSVQNATAVDLGFDVEGGAIVTLEVGQQQGYGPERARRFWDDLLERTRTTPGVRAAAISSWIPLGTLYSDVKTTASTSDGTGTRAIEQVGMGRVGPGYLETLGIDVRGRTFTAADLATDRPVVVVSDAAARRLWPDQAAIGKRVRTGGAQGPEYEVVGVAADVKVRTLGEAPQPFLYVPIRSYTGMLHLMVRIPSGEAAVMSELRRQVSAIDADVSVFQSVTIGEHLSLMLFPFRIAAAVSAALGLLGLTLAAVGLYGVVSYGVAQRTREMGVRIALGAQARDVVRLVVGEGMRVVLGGVLVGIALAFLVTQLLSSVLFGISATDPVTFLVTPAVMAGVAVLASLIPARRATGVDPVRALVSE